MSEIVRLDQVTSWKRALNAARRTIGKAPLAKEPSKSWEAKMLLAEHSPIRLVEFDWTWKDIMQWVTTHLVRHHEGILDLSSPAALLRHFLGFLTRP